MSYPYRPIVFVLAASNHGSMIVSRHDHHASEAAGEYGVGFQILDKGSFDRDEVNFVLALLDSRRRNFGDGVVAIDGGANIGVHTVEWARHMFGWGSVLGFEAQEVVFYALAGNVVLNNCLNARVRHAALGEARGELSIPEPNYFAPASFGSLELRRRADTEFIGQEISYEAGDCSVVPMINLDSLGLDRLDLVKLDVEGMELDVLHGGRETLRRHRPVMVIEAIKSDRAAMEAFVVELGYRVFPMGINLLAVHPTDPVISRITLNGDNLSFAI